MDVPREAVGVLVKALGAYLRATPAGDLPASVRRLREFHPRALEQHADFVLGLLADDAQKTLIEQWLDKSKTSLRRSEIDALRIALEQRDGWADDLRSLTLSRKQPAKTKASAPPKDAGERDKAREAKSRDELRKAREERDAARRRQRAVESELAAAQTEIVTLASELKQVRKDEGRAREALEKERRRSEREVARAQARTDAARRELKEVRRALASAQKELERRQRKGSARRAPSPDRRESKPRARRPLPVPKGRLADDPETLNEWLKAPGVHVLVDGYNVALAKADGEVRDLAARRRRLVDGLATVMRMKQVGVTVVFDGSDVPPGTARRSRGPVRVEYSRPDEIADDHLIAKLEAFPADPVIVATNDRELQRRAAALGATIATSDQLLALIR